MENVDPLGCSPSDGGNKQVRIISGIRTHNFSGLYVLLPFLYLLLLPKKPRAFASEDGCFH